MRKLHRFVPIQWERRPRPEFVFPLLYLYQLRALWINRYPVKRGKQLRHWPRQVLPDLRRRDRLRCGRRDELHPRPWPMMDRV